LSAREDDFEQKIAALTGGGLYACLIETIQVNVGLLCNQECVHCHLGASPARTETMDWPIMEAILTTANQGDRPFIDITGGAPELNPHLCRFIEALRKDALRVQVRTNLTALLEAGQEKTATFFRDHRVQLVASLPCYSEREVRAQRGEGAFERSIQALRQLNSLGYGIDPALALNLVYNPGGPFLPPERSALEAEYRHQLDVQFGVFFTHLLTLTNMPVGRFRRNLNRKGQEEKYLGLLYDSFNERTIEKLMCRNQICVAWDGRLFDCDFNLALGQAVDHGAPDHIRDFNHKALSTRRIVTGPHCFGCTAGSGSSCGGALL
jgi:radical SAM/Cys-rich protein